MLNKEAIPILKEKMDFGKPKIDNDQSNHSVKK